MFCDLWRGWCAGRLAPRRFVSLYLIVWAAIFVLIVVGGTMLYAATIGAGEEPAHPAMKAIGVAGVLLLLMLIAAIYNISLKRGRDAGVPGFVTGILFFLLIPIGGVSIFVVILLALIPTDTIAPRSRPEQA